MLDERGAASPDRTGLSTVHSMEELASGNDADRAILFADRLIQRLTPSLGVDQDGGVYQDGHSPLGGPMAFRPASTSSAKFSSGEGAESISPRHLAAETKCPGLIGRICTTGTPLRTTSISSPAPIRLTTAEKSRATSVALKRVMQRMYQINLI